MFPAPSPNTSALFNSLLGAQTPNTLDFMKTGLIAKQVTASSSTAPTSHSTESLTTQSLDLKFPATSGPSSDSFVHPDTDAANGLFLLAQSNGASRPGFAGSQVPAVQVNGSHGSPKMSNGSPDSDLEMRDSSTEPEAPKRGSRSSRAKKPTGKAMKEAKTPVSAKTPNNKRKRVSPPPKDSSPPPSTGSKKEKGHMGEEEKRKNFLERNR
jgi:ATF/CREB family transcription factor